MRRKRLSTWMISLACLYSPVFLAGQVNLSQTPDMSELPFVIVRPNGEVMVAWTEGHFNGWGVIWYRTYTDQTGWFPARIAVSPERGSAAFPQMAVDSQGNVHMAYMDGTSSYNREIYYIKCSNGQWGQREMIYHSYQCNSTWPRIAVEGNRIYIIWAHNHTTDAFSQMDIYFQEKVDGGSWPAQPQNISQMYPSVSAHPFFTVRNSNVHAVWMDDNHYQHNWNIYYNERISGSWRNSVHLDPSWNQYCPAAAVDNHGNVHVIYANKGNPVWYMRKPPGGSWSSPVVISTGWTSVTTINFMKFHAGYLHAVWRQAEGEGDYIFYARGTTNGQWETPIRVSHGGQSEYPGVDIDSSGRVHIVYSDIGVGGERDIFYVRLDQLATYPIASFTASPMQGPPPLSVSFDASTSSDPDGYIVSYNWDFGDGTTGSGVKVSHTYQKKGLYTARLTVTDNEGQSSSDSKNIMVGYPPVALFNATPTSGGSPLQVQFDASASYDPDGAIISYKWDFGDGTTGDGKKVTHTYTRTGARTATLTVKDDDGFEAWSSTQINITIGPTASFTASPKRGAAPLDVEFDASESRPSEKDGTIVSYKWDFGNGKTGEGKRVIHTYMTHGTYEPKLTITDDKAKSASSSTMIQVLARPTASFTCSTMKGVVPLTVTFDASASSDPDGWIATYRWDLGDGTHVTGKTVTHTYHRGGNMVALLTVIDNDGIHHSTSKIVEVLDKPYPPLNLAVEKLIFRGLFLSDYINVLTWKRNPANDGYFSIAKHRIYKKKKGEGDASFVLLNEVDASTFRYEDSGLGSEKNMENYVYAVTAVDDRSRESERTTASLSSSAEKTFVIQNPSGPPEKNRADR